MPETQLTDAQILSAFREFMSRQKQGPTPFEPGKNHPEHRGVVQSNFVRQPPTEYPRMMHHKSGMTCVVQDRKEQDKLDENWFTFPQKKKADWRSKAQQVFTKSGFEVRTYHVAFLQETGVPNVENTKTAAEFLDKLDDTEQEQFFAEAENFNPDPVAKEPEKEAAKEPVKKGSKKAA
jgi:hypothetical protein